MRFYWIAAFFALFLAACDGPEEREAKYLERGRELYEQGEYTKASLEFKNALQIKPNGVEGRYYLGLIAERRNEWRAKIISPHATHVSMLRRLPFLELPEARYSSLPFGQ